MVLIFPKHTTHTHTHAFDMNGKLCSGASQSHRGRASVCEGKRVTVIATEDEEES